MAVVVCLLMLFAVAGASDVTVTVRHNDGTTVALPSNSTEITALPGENLTLICESYLPIKWVYPNISDVERREILTKHGTKYVSELTLIDVSYRYVGDYICCSSNSVPCPQDASHIYLYVKDNNNPLPYATGFISSSGVEFTDIVIPCKPTHPDVPVAISLDGSTKLQTGDNEDVGVFRYDSKKGFILEHATMRNNGYYFCCLLQADGNTIEECPLTVHLAVLKHTNGVAKPNIDDTAIQHVVVGDNVTLECKITVLSAVKFELAWRDFKQSDRIVQENVILDSNKYDFGAITGIRKLNIYNVTLKDAGNYTCHVTDHQKNENSETIHLKVYGKNESYISISVAENKTEFEIPEGKTLKWVIYVDAHPPAELVWFDPNGNEIYNNSKIFVSTLNNGREAILEIPNVRLEDRGNYTLQATNGNYSKHVELKLVVLGKPFILLTKPIMFFETGGNVTVNCTVWGIPRSEVIWHFHPYYTSKSQVVSDKQVIISEKEDCTVSQLNMKFNTSGNLECIARNKYGNDTITTEIVESDIPDGFGILSKLDPIVMGDAVTLTCRASMHYYTNQMKWFKFHPESNEENELTGNSENQNGISVIRGNTNLSYEISLNIKNVSLSDRGRYKCTAHLKNSTKTDQVFKQIQVHEQQKPSFKGNPYMNGAEHLLEISSQFQLHCEPKGMPPPIITWEKNGKPFLPKPNDTMELRNNTTTLTITKFKKEHAGVYTCVATNPRNSSEKASVWATLKVKDQTAYDPGLIAGVAVISVVLCGLLAILLWKIAKEKRLYKERSFAGLTHFTEGAAGNLNPDLPVDEQADLLPYDKKWEFPREKLRLGKQLGSGAFGVVMKAEAYGIIEGEPITTVAVKMVKRNSDYTYIKALASELKIMVHLGKHLNVVNLLGACTSNIIKKELLVIVEYCRFGNLHNYLLRHREEFIDQIDPKTGLVDPSIGAEILARSDSFSKHSVKYPALTFTMSAAGDNVVDYRAAPPISQSSKSNGSANDQVSMIPTGDDDYVLSNNSAQPEWRSNYRGDYKGNVRPICTRDLICWAFQVARGMEYLAARKVLHGDLAARNILLADDNIVKICDFGLAKTMYKTNNYKKKGDGPLPFKWMAIESIRDRVFSTQSDIWSFGIVLWEFFSLARTPYPGMEADEKLYNKLVNGYRMDKPQYATVNIHQTMLDCWHANPNKRPTFEDLSHLLGNMLEDSVRRHYIDLNDPYMEMNAEWMQNSQNDYLSMMSAPTYGNFVSPNEECDSGYINSPLPVCGARGLEADGPSGYLHMGSPSLSGDDIFTPHSICKDDNVFSYDFPHRKKPHLKETDDCTGAELRPMLRSTVDSENELNGQFETENGTKFMHRQCPTNKNNNPSFSNPGYQSISCINPSADNYVNMPEQKTAKKKDIIKLQEENVHSFSNPSYITGVVLQDKISNSLSPSAKPADTELSTQCAKPGSYVNLPCDNVTQNGVIV